MQIRGTTAIYGIIGHPVTHSLSPLFQNWFLERHGIDAAYLPLPVADATHLPTVLAGLHGCGVEGFNVTVPHKERVAALVECDRDARIIGAVNTVRRTAGGWQATNTDHVGIQQVLTALTSSPRQQEVTLFGAGGTARAVLHACDQIGIRRVWLCNRTLARAERLVETAEAHDYQTVVTTIDWDQQAVTRACQRSAIIINTTTIGLHDHAPFPFALPPCAEGDGNAAFDAVYRPDGVTSFTSAAANQGRRAIDGLPLLIAQGVAAFYYWHHLSMNRQQAMDYICHQLKRPPCQMNDWGGDQ